MAKKGKHHKGHRHHKHHNPGEAVMKAAPSRLKEIAVVGAKVTVGYIGMAIAENLLPANIKANEPMKLAAKTGIALAVTLVLPMTKVVKLETAVEVGTGMIVNTIVDAINAYGLTKYIPFMAAAPAAAATGKIVGRAQRLSRMINAGAGTGGSIGYGTGV